MNYIELMIRLATNDIVFGCLWAGPCCNHVWCPINGEFPLRHGIAIHKILMGSATSQHRIWPIFWWQHVAKNRARHFLQLRHQHQKIWCFFWGGCSQRRHLTKQTVDLSPVVEFLGPQDQCSRDATVQNFFHEPVMKKWAAEFLHSSGSPKKRHLRSTWPAWIFLQDTWNHKKKYPWITSCQLPCLTVEIVALQQNNKASCWHIQEKHMYISIEVNYEGKPVLGRLSHHCAIMFHPHFGHFFKPPAEPSLRLLWKHKFLQKIHDASFAITVSLSKTRPFLIHFSSTMALMYFAILFF